MGFHYVLVQYGLSPLTGGTVQGNSGKIYGQASYFVTRNRHEFKMSSKDYEEAHRDLSMALRRRGSQWLAVAHPDPLGPQEGDELGVLTDLHAALAKALEEIKGRDAEIALLRSKLDLSDSLEPAPEITEADLLPKEDIPGSPAGAPLVDANPTGGGETVASNPTPATTAPADSPVSTDNGESGDPVVRVDVPLADQPLPATLAEMPEDYDEMLVFAKKIGLTYPSKPKKATLKADIEAKLTN